MVCGQARDPAAGEYVLADVELGVAHADVADEVQHAQPAGLEKIGVRLDHLAQLVAAGVLEHADRNHLVELGVHLAEIRLAHFQLVGQPASARSAPRSHSTCSVVVLTPHTRAPYCSQARNMKPPKPQPMSTTLSPGFSRILLHTWSILLRCGLLDGARALASSRRRCTSSAAGPASSCRSRHRARSGSARWPWPGAMRAIAEPELVPLIAQPDQGLGCAVEPALEGRRAKALAEIAVDVQRLVEVRFEHPDVAETDRCSTGRPTVLKRKCTTGVPSRF